MTPVNSAEPGAAAPAGTRGRRPAPAPRAGPDQPAVEERAQPLGRVQEVQRRAATAGCRRRSGPTAARPSAVARSWPSFSIAMYSCVPANERRQRLVEGVVEDRLRPGPARRARSTTSSNVRFMSSIIASSEPPAAASTPRTGRGVVVQLGQAHRLGQPPGRVDGEHDDRAAALGRAQRQRRRRRGLADAAGAAADDDARRRVGEQRVEVERAQAPRASRSPAHAAPCSRRSLGQLVAGRRGRRPRRAAAARTSAGRAPATRRALALLERHPRRRGRAASSSSASRDASRVGSDRARPGEAGELEVRRGRAVPLPAAPPGRRRGSSGARAMLTMTPPTGSPAALSSASASTVSCTGISSSSVTRCTAVCGERSTAMTRRPGCGSGRPGQPGDLGVDVEEPGDPAGGRGVEHDGVVHRAPAARVRRTASYDLAGEQHVAQPGRDRRGEVDAPILRSARPARRRL